MSYMWKNAGETIPIEGESGRIEIEVDELGRKLTLTLYDEENTSSRHVFFSGNDVDIAIVRWWVIRLNIAEGRVGRVQHEINPQAFFKRSNDSLLIVSADSLLEPSSSVKARFSEAQATQIVEALEVVKIG